MKIKNIKSHKELIGGQFYIKLTINPFGEKLLQVYKILGKPKKHKGYLKIKVEAETKTGVYQDFRHVSDLIGVRFKVTSGDIQFCGSKLFKYDSKTFEFLKKLEVYESLSVIINNDCRVTSLSLSQMNHLWLQWHQLERGRRFYES